MYFLNQFLICLSIMFATLDCMEKVPKEDNSSMGRFTPTPPADYYYLPTNDPLLPPMLNGTQGVVTEKGQIAILRPEKQESPAAFKTTCADYNITIIDQPTNGHTVASCYVDSSQVVVAEQYTSKIITTFAKDGRCDNQIVVHLLIDRFYEHKIAQQLSTSIRYVNQEETKIPPKIYAYPFPLSGDKFIFLAPMLYSNDGKFRNNFDLVYYTSYIDNIAKETILNENIALSDINIKIKNGSNSVPDKNKLDHIFKTIYPNQRTNQGMQSFSTNGLEYNLYIDDINVIGGKEFDKDSKHCQIKIETLSRFIITQPKKINNVADISLTIYCLYQNTLGFGFSYHNRELTSSSSLTLLQIEQDNSSFFTNPVYFTKEKCGNEIREIKCETEPEKNTNNTDLNALNLNITSISNFNVYFQQTPEKKAQRESLVLQRPKPSLYLSLPVPSENNCELPLQIKTLFESLIKNINALSTNNSLNADAKISAEISNATLKNIRLLEGVYAELYTNAAKTVESRLSKAVETQIGNLLTAVEAIIKTQSKKIDEWNDQSLVIKAEFRSVKVELKKAEEDAEKSFTATCKTLTQELTNLFLQKLESQIKEHSNNLENINKTLQEPLTRLKTDLEKLKPALLELNEELKSIIAKSEALYTKFETLVNENKTNFDKIAEEHIENIQTQLNQQLTNALTKAFDEKIKDLTNEFKKENEKIISENNKQIEHLTNEFKSENKKQIETLTQENKKLKDQIEQLQNNNKSTVSSFVLKQMWQIALTVCVVFLINNFNTILAYKI